MGCRNLRPPILLTDNCGAPLLPRIPIEISRRRLWKNLNTAHLKPTNKLGSGKSCSERKPDSGLPLQNRPATGTLNLVSNDRGPSQNSS